MVDVAIEYVSNEFLLAQLSFPIIANQMNITGLDHHSPLLEYLHQIQLSQLSSLKALVGLRQNVENVFDLLFDLLVKCDGVVCVDGVKGIADKLFNVRFFFDMQLFQDLFVIENSLDDIKLFPLNEHFSVSQQQISLSNVVIDGFQNVEKHCQHVSAVVERDFLVLDSH